MNKIAADLKMGNVCEFVSMGDYSNHDLLQAILKHTGKADVWIATWAITPKPMQKILEMKQRGEIGQLRGLVDSKLREHSSKAYTLALAGFDELHFTKIHAKVFIVENANWAVVVSGSANFTTNRRIEQGMIVCNKASAEWHRNWIEDGFRKG